MEEKFLNIHFKIENKIITIIGKQDHYIAAYGGLKLFIKIKKIKEINISKKKINFL